MKQIVCIILILTPFICLGQNSEYDKSSYKEQGRKAPNTHYIGEAWLNGLLSAGDGLNYNITKATFKANSTLDWHKHSTPQVIIVVEGVGYYQEKGKQPTLMQVGDVIKCDSDIEHWHSSSKEKDVTYLAIYSGETVWTEVLSQENYDQVAEKLKGK